MKNVKNQQEGISQVAEIEIVYKPKIKAADRPQIRHPKEASDILLQNWDHNRIEIIEQFKVMLLNRGCRLLGIYEVSSGGLHHTVVDIRLIFGIALKTGACSIILAHNHPSGQLEPSEPDIELTQRIKEGCKLLDLKLHDHIIVCTNDYFSFSEKGLL